MSTMRDPKGILTLAAKLREHGYTVEARVIAVNPEVSINRARLRFEEQVAARGVGRFVNQAQHDVAYKGLADSVSALESARAVDAIRVYNASQREIYANQLVRGSWQQEPGAQQALTEDRVRTWTHAEYRTEIQGDLPAGDESQKRAERDKKAMEIGALIVEGFKRMERDPEFLREIQKRTR